MFVVRVLHLSCCVLFVYDLFSVCDWFAMFRVLFHVFLFVCVIVVFVCCLCVCVLPVIYYVTLYGVLLLYECCLCLCGVCVCVFCL